MSEPWRISCAMVLLCLFAALSSLHLSRSVHWAQPDANSPAGIEQQFAALRGDLPARGVVGFVSDDTDPLGAARHFYLAQYALAPLILFPGQRHETVVMYFDDPRMLDTVTGRMNGCVVLRYYGHAAVIHRARDRC